MSMDNAKKSSYNGNTEARKAATKKYLGTQDELKIRVPAGGKENIRKYADKVGKSVNQFVVDAVLKEMAQIDLEG